VWCAFEAPTLHAIFLHPRFARGIYSGRNYGCTGRILFLSDLICYPAPFGCPITSDTNFSPLYLCTIPLPASFLPFALARNIYSQLCLGYNPAPQGIMFAARPFIPMLFPLRGDPSCYSSHSGISFLELFHVFCNNLSALLIVLLINCYFNYTSIPMFHCPCF